MFKLGSLNGSFNICNLRLLLSLRNSIIIENCESTILLIQLLSPLLLYAKTDSYKHRSYVQSTKSKKRYDKTPISHFKSWSKRIIKKAKILGFCFRLHTQTTPYYVSLLANNLTHLISLSGHIISKNQSQEEKGEKFLVCNGWSFIFFFFLTFNIIKVIVFGFNWDRYSNFFSTSEKKLSIRK